MGAEAMIEEDIESLRDRMDTMEARFTKLAAVLAAEFGDATAHELVVANVKLESSERLLAAYKEGKQELLNEIMEALKILVGKKNSSGLKKGELVEAAKRVTGKGKSIAASLVEGMKLNPAMPGDD
jgi:hypothetical protein